MIINYWNKYTDFKLFFLKKMLKIIHIFHQEINKKIYLVVMMYRSLKVSHLFAPLPPCRGVNSVWRRIIYLIAEFSPPAKGECPKGEGVNHSVTILLNPDYGFYVITVFNSLH